jgi:hypothetical protein
MAGSALALALIGLPCVFAPDLVLARLSSAPTPAALLIVQILGALYLGFAAINWMGKANLIGGIYGRPVLIGNLLHFLAAGLAIVKAVVAQPELRNLWPLAAMYALLATGFAIVLLRPALPGISPRQRS